MPALKEISFEYARQIAAVKGLQPSKVRGTTRLRFTKGGSEKLQVITWDEFEKAASGRDLAVYESGGWMKLMRRQYSGVRGKHHGGPGVRRYRHGLHLRDRGSSRRATVLLGAHGCHDPAAVAGYRLE